MAHPTPCAVPPAASLVQPAPCKVHPTPSMVQPMPCMAHPAPPRALYGTCAARPATVHPVPCDGASCVLSCCAPRPVIAHAAPSDMVHPTPCAVHPALCIPSPAWCTRRPVMVHPVHCMVHPVHCMVHPVPCGVPLRTCSAEFWRYENGMFGAACQNSARHVKMWRYMWAGRYHKSEQTRQPKIGATCRFGATNQTPGWEGTLNHFGGP